MDIKTQIVRRVAAELQDNTLVNLGIGMPTEVANHVPEGITVYFQSENGIIGMGERPPEGMEGEHLTDAGGGFVTALPGAMSFDSALSFGFIRGRHLDLTVLGALQVDGKGLLANWMIPGKLIPGMGGAMDLVTGAKRVIIAMTHTAKGDRPKLVKECSLPLTSLRPVDLIVTELAVIEPTEEGLVLKERAQGVGIEEIVAKTEASLVVKDDVPEMKLAA